MNGFALVLKSADFSTIGFPIEYVVLDYTSYGSDNGVAAGGSETQKGCMIPAVTNTRFNKITCVFRASGTIAIGKYNSSTKVITTLKDAVSVSAGNNTISFDEDAILGNNEFLCFVPTSSLQFGGYYTNTDIGLGKTFYPIDYSNNLVNNALFNYQIPYLKVERI